MSSRKILLVTSIEKRSQLFIGSLWVLTSFFSAAKIDLRPNLTGVSIEFILQDVFQIMFISWLLHRGLGKRNVILIIPWFITTTYGLYNNQFKNFIKMLGILVNSNIDAALPWMAMFAAFMVLVLKLILIMRTLRLAAHLWYRQKVEREILGRTGQMM